MDHYDRYDERTRDAWKDKNKGVMKDGEALHVPMLFMDDKTKTTREVRDAPVPYDRDALDRQLLARGMGVLDTDRPYQDLRPRSAPLTDEDRARKQGMVADQNDRLSNAWRNGADQPEEEDEK